MTKSKTIGIFHYQVGHTDGVSLEIEKWQRVFEELGHTVHLCAGDLGDAEAGTLIPEMYHHIPGIKTLGHNTFKELRDFDAQGYKAELDRWTDVIAERIRDFVRQKGIDLIVAQNIWCVAASPPVAVALERVRREFDLPAIAHSHDFYWERTDGLALTCPAAIELADKYLPPRDDKIRHVVINSLAQRELAERKGMSSTIVPNIFDFEAPPWEEDDFNRGFRTDAGLKDDDIIVLQATRIVARKGIELAIDFVKALNAPERRARLEANNLYDGRTFTAQSRIVLVLAGYTLDDSTGQYLNNLSAKARREGVELVHIGDRIGSHRSIQGLKKIYSLWDTYVFADFISYPSLWEGWGNQLLEAVRARLPFLLFEYPVYKADIKEKGFKSVSLGSEIVARDEAGLAQVGDRVIQSAADKAVDLLINAEMRRDLVEHNYKIGRKYYSMRALSELLTKLLA